MAAVGVILAGGQSTRFGEDKSLYTLAGKEMYQYVADMLEETEECDEIIVSTNTRLKESFRLETITDEYEDRGPLGGIYSASKNFPGKRLIVVSCDTPYVSEEWIKLLVKKADAKPGHVIISAENGRFHPLIGVYQGYGLSDKLKKQIESEKQSMRAFFERVNLAVVDAKNHNIDTNIFQNINYKSDID